MLEIKRILCPTDFSEPSHHALAVAADFALALGAEVCVTHVVSVALVPAVDFELMYPVPEDALRAAANEQLHLVARHLSTRGIRATVLLASGDAGHEIVRVARDERCDLIVIASHGRGMVEHVLFGSVAERVVRLASCPVLCVPARGR